MNDPKRPFSPEVKTEAERWRRETFDPAAVRRPERKPFVTDVGIGIEPLYTPTAPEQILAALDLPTQCGYDSDHEMSTAEVGQVGVAIDTLADMELLFEGI